jgi:hypothetical protein
VGVAWTLTDEGERTRVTLDQDDNPSRAALREAERDWGTVLDQFKRYVERG